MENYRWVKKVMPGFLVPISVLTSVLTLILTSILILIFNLILTLKGLTLFVCTFVRFKV